MKRTALIAVTAGLALSGCGLGAGMFGSRGALVAVPQTCVPQRFEIYSPTARPG